MMIALTNPRAYVALGAGGMGEIECPTELQDCGDLFAWRTRDCVHQSSTAYARRYTGAGGGRRRGPAVQYPGGGPWQQLAWCRMNLEAVGGVLRAMVVAPRQGEWTPLDTAPPKMPGASSEACPRMCATGTPTAHTGPDRPSPTPRPWSQGRYRVNPRYLRK